MSSIFVTIALIFVVFFGLIIFDSVLYLKNGSNFKYLIKTRFSEILPLRSLFWIVFISFGSLFLLKLAILLNLLYRIIFQEERISSTINEATITGIITKRNTELRILPSLWQLRDEIVNSSLDFSVIRMKNARSQNSTSYNL